MRQRRGQLPARELRFRARRVRGNDLNSGIGEVLGPAFGKKYNAVVRSSQKAAQGKDAVDNLALPLRPDLGLGHRLASPTQELPWPYEHITKGCSRTGDP